MELVNWSLHAVDKIFSTRRAVPGEPACPQGTFPAGYMVDAWDKWRTMCLADLSVEDVEDVYLFGTMIIGVLLIGLCFALMYRQNWKLVAAVKDPTPLPARIEGLGRAQAAVLNRTDNILEKLSALQKGLDRLSDQNGQ